jgi:hypothetical protein
MGRLLESPASLWVAPLDCPHAPKFNYRLWIRGNAAAEGDSILEIFQVNTYGFFRESILIFIIRVSKEARLRSKRAAWPLRLTRRFHYLPCVFSRS